MPEDNVWITTSFRVKILDKNDDEIEISNKLRTELEVLGDEIVFRAMAGDDNFDPILKKIMKLLEENGFNSQKLSSRVVYLKKDPGITIENIYICYLD